MCAVSAPDVRRALIVTLFATMVVLAGCGGQLTENSADDSQPTTTLTAEDVSFPEGYSEDGVTGVEQAVDNHWTALEEAGTYRNELSYDVSSTGSGNRTIDADIIVTGDRGYLRKENGQDRSHRTFTADLYSPEKMHETVGVELKPLLQAEQFEFERVTSRNGTTLIEYRSDQLNKSKPLYSGVRDFNVTEHRATLVVDTEGRIREFEYVSEFEGKSDRIGVEMSVEFSGFGAAEAPDWAGKATTDAMDGSGSSSVERYPEIVNSVANVTESGTVDYVNLTVVRNGSADVDLSSVTVEWVGPKTAMTLPYGTDPGSEAVFSVVPVEDADDSAPVLNSPDDRFKVVINAETLSGKQLEAGQKVALKLTTKNGENVIHRVRIPESLEEGSKVSV